PMNLRQPIFTPFPYTTLFRSLHSAIGYSGAIIPSVLIDNEWRRVTGDKPPSLTTSAVERVSGSPVPNETFPAHRANFWAKPVLVDRKSTRLNSSHQIISYAVF